MKVISRCENGYEVMAECPTELKAQEVLMGLLLYLDTQAESDVNGPERHVAQYVARVLKERRQFTDKGLAKTLGSSKVFSLLYE